jgi:Protein of unknown function (DUF4238)
VREVVVNVPKNNHYVPQFILRNFANTKGKVWWVRKGEQPLRPVQRLAKDVFAENHLYNVTLENGVKDTRVETELCKFEDRVAPIVTALVDWNRALPCPVSVEDLLLLQFFVIQIYKRNPKTLKEHGTTDTVLKSFQDHYALMKLHGKNVDPLIEAEILTLGFAQNSLKEIQVLSVLHFSDEMNVALQNHGIILAYNADKNFVVGDNPIRWLKIPGLDGVEDETQLWFPVAPNLAISPVGPKDKLALLAANKNFVNSLNRQSWSHSVSVVAKTKSDLIQFND